jgi:hypothetical protein
MSFGILGEHGGIHWAYSPFALEYFLRFPKIRSNTIRVLGDDFVERQQAQFRHIVNWDRGLETGLRVHLILLRLKSRRSKIRRLNYRSSI